MRTLSTTERIESSTSCGCSACLKWLACSVEDAMKRVCHRLRMVDLDGVVEAFDNDVQCVGHKLREGILRLVPRTVVAVAEVRRHEGGQRALRDQGPMNGPMGWALVSRDATTTGREPRRCGVARAWARLSSNSMRSMAGYCVSWSFEGPCGRRTSVPTAGNARRGGAAHGFLLLLLVLFLYEKQHSCYLPQAKSSCWITSASF